MKLPEEIEAAFAPRPVDADKYRVGTVAVVGGCKAYANAPVIAALGARAAGAGLVYLVADSSSRVGAAAWVPEAVFASLGAKDAPPPADVFAVGMGLGRSAHARALVKRLLALGRGRFVLDADALWFLAQLQGFTPAPGQELVLTPHEGEAARLLGITREQVASGRVKAVRDIARRYGATVVLKGPRTLVSSPDGARLYENTTGNAAMALGGMGDLLAGALAARWAYLKADAFGAAAGAVWLHGAASDRLVAALGDPSIANTAAALGALRTQLDAQAGEGIYGKL